MPMSTARRTSQAIPAAFTNRCHVVFGVEAVRRRHPISQARP